jgi:cyanophycin synthetase
MLFEEMLRGTEYRVVCIDYTLQAVAFRKPAHVIGDGTHTIQQLIDEKNRHPWRGEGHENNLTKIIVDETVHNVLAEQQLTLDAVPTQDREVLLRKTANLSTGGEAWDVTDQVCAENKFLFEKIARVCDLSIVGIDVMCESLSTPIEQQSHAGVIEVNASPGLRMHHYPIQGKARNVAQTILESTLHHLEENVTA